MEDHPQNLLWLRRDLRLHDHAALYEALLRPGPVQPVFVFDTEILERFTNPKDSRLTFIAEALEEMDAALRKRGGGLLVLHGRAQEVIPRLVSALNAKAVCCAEDYEPATRARDASVKKTVSDIAEFVTVKDHLLAAPYEVLRADGSPYRVFTPYSRIWRDFRPPLQEYVIKDKNRYAPFEANMKRAQDAGLRVLPFPATSLLKEIGYQPQKLKYWPVNDGAKMLTGFVQQKLENYAGTRDIMGIYGTSRLSPYLRFGRISVRECARMAWDHKGSEKWINELIWRDFYAMILYHFPESATMEFNPQYRERVEWSHDTKRFKAFATGQTGYPVVDAAMRQLLEVGWMHNRARMIVASFMTKHLLLDWRMGEEHFAQHLMDYDLASNVGGWQWAASTGTDAQPYFRIFNPVLQSKKFDPDGSYIRRYVPELANLPDKDIHEPKHARPANYPAPMVEHQAARARALQAFKVAS